MNSDIAMSTAAKELIFVRNFFEELGVDFEMPMTIRADNDISIKFAESSGFSGRSRTIRLQYHNVRQMVHDKEIQIDWISGENNPADLLTKILSIKSTSKYCRFLYKH